MAQGAKAANPETTKVIILGAMIVLVLIYGVFAWMPKKPAATPATETKVENRVTPAEPPPVDIAEVPGVTPGMALGSGVRKNPFAPDVALPKPGAPSRPAPAPQRGGGSTGGRTLRAPGLPSTRAIGPQVGRGGVATVTPAAPVAPAPAPAPVPVTPPERPNVSVTGIIDTEGAPGMALISVASDQRIIQVGDVLPQNYRVKRIWNNGIELVNGRDRFFVALGEGSQAAKPAGKG